MLWSRVRLLECGDNLVILQLAVERPCLTLVYVGTTNKTSTLCPLVVFLFDFTIDEEPGISVTELQLENPAHLVSIATVVSMGGDALPDWVIWNRLLGPCGLEAFVPKNAPQHFQHEHIASADTVV